ncbi:hypothetical protein [Actinorhabdospora filicis]|uniref:hypothetical protein n=1 Tax=Actinorhabdospora filicis TaxID=1785913 RepID=UPI002553A9E2|nr:hypothetical protein [Actinorhabdospora filicis]
MSIDPVADFARRVMRFSPDGLVRTRASASGTARLWAVLPFKALVCLDLPVPFEGDVVVSAADLAAGGASPSRRHEMEWRTTLPATDGRVIETVPAADLRRVDAAAAETLRARRGQGVGDRRLRDALLDHVALTVEGEHEVPLRLVTALFRMGLHTGEEPVSVRLAGRRIGLAGSRGIAWGMDPGLRLL